MRLRDILEFFYKIATPKDNQFTSHLECIDLWTLLVLQGFWDKYHTG